MKRGRVSLVAVGGGGEGEVEADAAQARETHGTLVVDPGEVAGDDLEAFADDHPVLVGLGDPRQRAHAIAAPDSRNGHMARQVRSAGYDHLRHPLAWQDRCGSPYPDGGDDRQKNEKASHGAQDSWRRRRVV